MVKLTPEEEHYILRRIPDAELTPQHDVKWSNGKITPFRWEYVRTTPEIIRRIENGDTSYRLNCMAVARYRAIPKINMNAAVYLAKPTEVVIV